MMCFASASSDVRADTSFFRLYAIRASLAFMFILVGGNVFSQDTLSLRECILFTLIHHPNSSIYQNNVVIAKEKIRQSKAALLPSISGTATLAYNPKLQVNIIPAGAFGPQETKLVLGTKYASGGYIEMEQVLLNKAYILDVKTSNLDKEIAELNLIEENENLVYNTAVAFYAVLAQQEKIRLSQESEKRELALQQIMKLQYDQGLIKINEYNRALVTLKNTQAELSLHQTNHEQALSKIKFAMGMDLQSSIWIVGNVKGDEVVIGLPDEEFNPSNLIAFKVDQYDLSNKELTVKRNKSAYLPTLSLTAKYGANGFGGDFTGAYIRFFDYGLLTAKLSIPIFNGFKRNAALAESKLAAANQRLTQKINTDNYNLSYQSSRTALFSSVTSLKKNKETLDLAKAVVESSSVDYKAGTATYSTWLADDYTYKEAFSNYITSLIDYHNARLDYEKSKGTLSDYLQLK